MKRSVGRLRFQSLEPRRMLAATLAAPDPIPQSEYESDPRLIAMFHGPVQPGRPVPPIQGVAAKRDTLAEDDFPQGDAGQADSIQGDPSGPLEAPPFPLDQTFKLHSRPDSNFTIYLDFDGHTTVGTSWNSGYGIAEIVHPNYWGGTGSNFSDARLELIQEIWQIVAEDFAPFDVNVTTEEPIDLDDLRYGGSEDTRWGSRVVMTKDTFASCGCGGHAYLGSFDDSEDEPALVYNGGLNNGSETVSHEVGHQLGLNHDGAGTTTYYSGHGSGDTGWGPIMGAPFSKRTTQWNNGDYFNASNPAQDDLSVITRSSNFPFAPDDHSNQRASATALQESNLTEVEAFGIIETNDDVDWFRFTTGAGIVSLNIDVLGYKPNLDVWAGLYDSAGVFITDSNPQSALSASFESLSLDAGEYFIKIDGVARDNSYDSATDTFVEPTPPPYTVSGPQGYSDYGSLGQYRINGSIIDPGQPTVSIVAVTPSVVEGNSAELALTTSDGGGGDVTIQIRPTRQTAPGLSAPDSTETADFSGAMTQVVSIVDGNATIQIPILDDAEIERQERFEVHLVDAGDYAVADRVAAVDVTESKTSYGVFATAAVSVEGDGTSGATHQFTVNRYGRLDTADTLDWRRIAFGSDPANGADFTSADNGTIEFAVGETSHVITVNVSGDIDVEPDETYAIELIVPVGQNFLIEPGRESATGRINDDESVIELASAAQFRMRQVNYSNGSFDNWAFDNFRITGTEIVDDFDPAIDQSVWESVEGAFAVNLFPASDGNALFFTGAGNRAATTIPVSPPPGAQVELSIIFAGQDGAGINATEPGEDALLEYSLNGIDWIEIQRFDESEYTAWTNLVVDLPPDVTFTPTAFAEGDTGASTQSISITRTGYIDKAITVDWAITPGIDAPVSADDFVGGLPSGTASFDVGQQTAVVEVLISGDTEVELDESFRFSVSANSGGPILNPTMTATIINDDFATAEIHLVGANAQPIADGDLLPSLDDGTDFGLVGLESDSRTQSFTIQNLGVLDLAVSSVSLTGPDAADFAVSVQPDALILPGQSSPFQIVFDPSALGRRDANVVIANDDSNESNYTFAVTGLASDLGVEAVEVNDGEATRSRLSSVKVRFNQTVQHPSVVEAFEIRNLTTQQLIRSVIATPTDVNGKTEVLLQFENQSPAPVILDDGNYELRVLAARVNSYSAGASLMVSDFVFGTEAGMVDATDAFFRFYGDTDGDRDVDAQDYGAFGLSFLQDVGSPLLNDQLDADGDGDVDGRDFSQFRLRFTRRLGT